VQAQSLKDEFLRAVDDDARAFDAVMAANRLSKTTHDEQARRESAIQVATKRAIDVPLGVVRLCEKTLPLVERVSEKGNKNSISDAGVAALVLGAAARGAWLNVLINLPGLSDRSEASRIAEEGDGLAARVAEGAGRVADRVAQSLAS
jgi:glutamate formiminotransferase/formiminotetrahydrofolate cyclodeaminase